MFNKKLENKNSSLEFYNDYTTFFFVENLVQTHFALDNGYIYEYLGVIQVYQFI